MRSNRMPESENPRLHAGLPDAVGFCQAISQLEHAGNTAELG